MDQAPPSIDADRRRVTVSSLDEQSVEDELGAAVQGEAASSSPIDSRSVSPAARDESLIGEMPRKSR